MSTYALNGLSRIGKLPLKPLLERGAKIAWLNDALGDPWMHAHFLKFDTFHRRRYVRIETDEDSITIDGMRLPVHARADRTRLPLAGWMW